MGLLGEGSSFLIGAGARCDPRAQGGGSAALAGSLGSGLPDLESPELSILQFNYNLQMV